MLGLLYGFCGRSAGSTDSTIHDQKEKIKRERVEPNREHCRQAYIEPLVVDLCQAWEKVNEDVSAVMNEIFRLLRELRSS